MLRRVAALVTALALGLAGGAQAAAPAPAAGWCSRPGLTVLALPHGEFGCVHTAGDAYDSHAQSYAMAMRIKPATAPVPCYGDGTTGPRIQFLYGFYDGLPNRIKAVTAEVRSQIAPRMQAVVNGQGHGLDLGLRFAMEKGCKGVSVIPIHVPRTIQYTGSAGDPNGQLKRLAAWLDAHGFNRSDRKYQVLWDGWNIGACGVGLLAELAPGGQQLSSLPVSPLVSGAPTVGGHTDPTEGKSQTLLLGSLYSMVFNHAGGPKGPSCFNTQGISTVTPELHELFHTLGAVQFDAPHANSTGHCDDAPSVMCPGQGPGYGGGVKNPSCAKVLIETLDCGEDDYWGPSAPAGSYLSTHWNIAKSTFFGSQPQDSLAALPF